MYINQDQKVYHTASMLPGIPSFSEVYMPTLNTKSFPICLPVIAYSTFPGSTRLKKLWATPDPISVQVNLPTLVFVPRYTPHRPWLEHGNTLPDSEILRKRTILIYIKQSIIWAHDIVSISICWTNQWMGKSWNSNDPPAHPIPQRSSWITGN